MANIICFKQEKGLKNCSNRQLKVTAKHKIYPDGQKKAHLENRRGVGHCPMCSVICTMFELYVEFKRRKRKLPLPVLTWFSWMVQNKYLPWYSLHWWDWSVQITHFWSIFAFNCNVTFDSFIHSLTKNVTFLSKFLCLSLSWIKCHLCS